MKKARVLLNKYYPLREIQSSSLWNATISLKTYQLQNTKSQSLQIEKAKKTIDSLFKRNELASKSTTDEISTNQSC